MFQAQTNKRAVMIESDHVDHRLGKKRKVDDQGEVVKALLQLKGGHTSSLFSHFVASPLTHPPNLGSFQAHDSRATRKRCSAIISSSPREDYATISDDEDDALTMANATDSKSKLRPMKTLLPIFSFPQHVPLPGRPLPPAPSFPYCPPPPQQLRHRKFECEARLMTTCHNDLVTAQKTRDNC